MVKAMLGANIAVTHRYFGHTILFQGCPRTCHAVVVTDCCKYMVEARLGANTAVTTWYAGFGIAGFALD